LQSRSILSLPTPSGIHERVASSHLVCFSKLNSLNSLFPPKNSLIRRKNSLFLAKNSLFFQEQGIGLQGIEITKQFRLSRITGNLPATH
jgi:hypothetical protein